MHLFDTAIGRCAVGWSEHGIASIQLPGPSDAQLRARVRGRLPDAEEGARPPAIEEAVARIRALLGGAADDLADLPLDMEHVPAFHRRVYEHARRVGPGSTITYGELAARAGKPGGARAVGQAMGRNPFPIVVPCHRVLAAGGRAGGFSAPGGVGTKLRMLAIERPLCAASAPLFDALPASAHADPKR